MRFNIRVLRDQSDQAAVSNYEYIISLKPAGGIKILEEIWHESPSPC